MLRPSSQRIAAVVIAAAAPGAFAIQALPPVFRVLAALALGIVAIRLLRSPRLTWTGIAAAAALCGYAIASFLGVGIASVAGVGLWLRGQPALAPKRWVTLGLAFGVACGWAAVVVNGMTSRGFRAHLYPYSWERPLLSLRPAAVLFVVLVAALNAVGEEWLFRRFLLHHLRSAGLSSFLSVSLSSLSFGAAHIRNGLPGGLVGFLLTAAFGAVMGTAYVAQPNPRPFILSAHFSADLVLIWHALSL